MRVKSNVELVLKMPKHLLLLLFFIANVVRAQQPVQTTNPCVQQQCFVATQTSSITGSASTTITIQQPATGARQVVLSTAVIQCQGQAFTVTQAQNGTAATATAGSAVPILPISTVNGGTTPVTAAAKIFTASNVGTGTATAVPYAYGSGSISVIDLSRITIGATTSNYSVTVTNNGGSSCTESIALYWSEKI